MSTRNYVIRLRYMEEGVWQTEVIKLPNVTMDVANDVATGWASNLDERYGSDHFWNVMIQNMEGDDIYEYFHGRIK